VNKKVVGVTPLNFRGSDGSGGKGQSIPG